MDSTLDQLCPEELQRDTFKFLGAIFKKQKGRGDMNVYIYLIQYDQNISTSVTELWKQN